MFAVVMNVAFRTLGLVDLCKLRDGSGVQHPSTIPPHWFPSLASRYARGRSECWLGRL